MDKELSVVRQTKSLSDAMKRNVRWFVFGMTMFTLGFGIGLVPFSNFFLSVMIANYILFMFAFLLSLKRIIRLTKYLLFFNSWAISTASYGFLFVSFVYCGEKASPLKFTIFALLYGIAIMATYFISYRYWDKKWNEHKEFNLSVLNLEKAQYNVELAFKYQDDKVARRELSSKQKIREFATRNAILIAMVVQVVAIQFSEHGYSNLIFSVMSVLGAYAGLFFLSFSVVGIYGTMKVIEYEKVLQRPIVNWVNEG